MTHNGWLLYLEPTTEWKHRGITCRVYSLRRGDVLFQHNGYLELPEDHPARPLDLQFDDCGVFDVHGGITYGGCGSRVIGWDTNHSGDASPLFPGLGGRVWTVNDVVKETTRLADQVADLYTPEAIAMHKAATQLRELADELDPTKETHA